MTIGLTDRTAALASAVRVAEGRLDPDLLARGRAVVAHARERTGLSADHTVVALAGATGSGKSSVFNALVGAELAEVGVRRPTTSRALAAVWGPDGVSGAGPLLDWLEVRRRHEMSSPLTAGGEGPASGLRRVLRPRAGADLTSGLVLLDLPDHDSVVVEHRVRAERLVERADLLVWVVDPQKYADAVLHEHYLRPLAEHAAVTVVVLNQVDRLTPDDAAACLDDLRRRVTEDGLAEARILGASARTGEGLDELRALLADAAAQRRAANDRIAADERGVARRIAAACGASPPARSERRARDELVDAFEAAAGVPAVVAAVRGGAERDARAATGWPLTRWTARFRADPLRRIGLRPRPAGGKDAPPASAGLVRTSLPVVPATVRAGARTAVRAYVDGATTGVPDAWALAARRRAADATEGLADELDQAVVGVDLELGRRPLWWRTVGLLQWLVLAALVVGVAWLGVLWAFVYLRLPELAVPVLSLGTGDVPWPTLLAVGGLVLGVVTGLVARVAARVGARRRAARVRRRLRAAVALVGDRLVRLPVGDELDALARCRTAAVVASSS
ncbi:GTPase [Cellulosimicrobium arenosum]|uniref:50S ribosome-binding GTPase n=1 Tax=Cellulosimicrobium arenosum TaxID=2708133 RepID=A0A927J2I7_9MICO|nr:50S ribosome-binding GTPase [Cellulosimicrobium arenosum]